MLHFDRQSLPLPPYPDEPDPYTEGYDEDDEDEQRRDPPW